MTRILFIVLAILGIVSVFIFVNGKSSQRDLVQVNAEEYGPRIPVDDRSFLAKRVEILAKDLGETLNAPPTPIAATSTVEFSTSTSTPQTLFPDREIIVRNSQAPPTEGPIERTPDEDFLHFHASQFAYVEFKGVIGGRSLATLCTEPNKPTLEVVGEGERFNEVKIAKIKPESLLVSYGSAPPLEKPLIHLEVDYKPNDQLTGDERKERELRYRELYGNRMREGSRHYRKERGEPVPAPPSAEEQVQNAEAYQQTYGRFFESLHRGELPGGNNREFPEGARTLEESVSDYFDTYWPDQVEWEVTEETNDGEK